MPEVPVSLSTICGGAMEDQFQRLVPALLSQLKHGQKASVAINIDFKRVDDTDTMINASYKLTPKCQASIHIKDFRPEWEAGRSLNYLAVVESLLLGWMMS